MRTKAAVLVETGRPLEIWDLGVPRLAAGQVLVELAYSGVCHTQLLEWQGLRGEDRFLPHCLGHEGSGTVVEVGSAVTKVAAGDDVVLSWMKGRGGDARGTVYDSASGPVNAGGVTTFQHHAVVSENRLTPLPDGCSLRQAALLGCAIPTGFGSLLNTAGARQGESVAVFGCGGIGASAVLAAAVLGCTPIVAVDVAANKLEFAATLGSTHTVMGGDDAVAAVHEITSGGVDVAIEASGRPSVMAQALASVRARGGRAVVVGNAPHGEQVPVDPRELNQGKQLLGTWGGDCDPDADFARFAAQVVGHADQLCALAPTLTPLEDINCALEALGSGSVVRPMLSLQGSE
ncbi:MAG: zinc-binding dehydrogenase [Planctomycetota bacterium]